VAPTASPRLRAPLVFFVALVVIVAGAFGWSRLADDAGADEEIRLDTPGEYVEPGAPTNPPLPTDLLPDVELVGADGSAVRLPDGDDRPMVINLWYSTCAPCARELVDFAEVHGEVGDAVRFVGINPYDTAATMERFAGDRGVRYELLRDPGFAFTDELRIVAYPVTLFVDGDGRIVGRTGPIDDDELRRHVAEHFGAA
jgi:thiol-disulfide isomerase/thioredoxin